jgi:predicted secreted protein
MITTSTDAMNRSLSCRIGWARIIVLSLALAVLPGCNALKLAYNAAPTAGYWWLDSYLDFDSVQAARLRDELDGLQRWHRSTQLPEYARLLQRAQRLVAQEQIQPAEACTLLDDARRAIGDIAVPAGSGTANLVESLTPAQLAHLQAKYAKSNAEFHKEWIAISPQQVREKRFDKALERAERVYGRLDEAQRTVMREQLALSSFDAALQQAERMRRQQDTLQVLRELVATKATPEQAATALRSLFDRYRESPDPALRAYAQRQFDEGCRSFAAAHATATPAQREHAVQRLASYERDVRDLAAQQR